MTLPVLYTFRRCPYAMRARMALAVAGVSWQVREVLLRDKPKHMLELSPKGTVPVLWFPETGEVIDESADVMLWALQQADPWHWLPQAEGEGVQWMQRCELEFKPNLDRYKYETRYAPEEAVGAFDAAAQFLSEIEGVVRAKTTPPDFLDVALFPFVRQFANVDRARFDSLGLNHLGDWLDHLVAHPLFLSVMAKYPLWQPDSPKIEFHPQVVVQA